jgi:phospholipid/cholesterol/gamma-HCH transport system permease protein
MALPISQTASRGAEVRQERGEGDLPMLRVSGRLDSGTTGGIWREALRLAGEAGSGELVVDASDVDYCDSAGASLFLALREQRQAAGGSLAVRGLRPEFQRVLALIEPSREAPAAEPAPRDSFLVGLGRSTLAVTAELRQLVVFTGHLVVCLGQALRRPRSIRFGDVMLVAERAGIGAVPIIGLVGFLLGLILSFQSAVSLQRFGAQIFVADFLGIAMFRELGPLMAAILLTARSGSAFAAEIGTMKVNEELDALSTMGLEPVSFLVVPRVIAGMLVIPALIMLMSLAGLVGGALVFLSLDFPLVTFVNRIQASTSVLDLLGGVFKGFVYGVIVVAVGCLRGTQTGTGASAVGETTTSAVVSGIVLIAVAAAIFSVTFYVLGI